MGKHMAEVHREYTMGQQLRALVQWSNESKKKPNAVIHSYSDLKKNSFRSRKERSHPSKLRAFRTFQKHHIKQWGTAFQILTFRYLPTLPCQQAIISRTLFGITHCTPNTPNTIAHKSLVIEQWISRWSTVSPLPPWIFNRNGSRTLEVKN